MHYNVEVVVGRFDLELIVDSNLLVNLLDMNIYYIRCSQPEVVQLQWWQQQQQLLEVVVAGLVVELHLIVVDKTYSCKVVVVGLVVGLVVELAVGQIDL